MSVRNLLSLQQLFLVLLKLLDEATVRVHHRAFLFYEALAVFEAHLLVFH
jgi:hypothetical protein